MNDLSEVKQKLIKDLLKNKKFHQLEFEVNSLLSEKRSSFLLNLLGVCKISKIPTSKKDLNESLDLFKEAYLKDKTLTDALFNYSEIATRLFKYGEAKDLLTEYLDIVKYNYKANLALAKIHFYLGNMDECLKNYKKIIDNNEANSKMWAAFLFTINYTYKYNQKEYLSFCYQYSDKLEKFDDKVLRNFQYEKNPEKLRIGFFSADLRTHSVAKFIEETLKILKQNNFEIIAFSNNKLGADDLTTERLKGIFDEWYDIIKLSDLEAINLIRDKKINILFDLTGFSTGNRCEIFKNKSAPLQISWCGYCNSSGIKEIDYLIADQNLIKKEEEFNYSEEIIRLPKIWNSHFLISSKIEINELPALKNKFITFGSFNNYGKLSNETIEIWSKILKNNNSKLILKTSVHDHQLLRDNIMSKFKKNGIENHKIIFMERLKSNDDHLKLYNKIDISLDTFPFGGATTTIESLWMGVPTITLSGEIFNSKFGVSINKNLNLNNFIAKNKIDYIEKAKVICSDLNKLSHIRKSLRNLIIDSALFDSKNLGLNLSKILKEKWNLFSKQNKNS